MIYGKDTLSSGLVDRAGAKTRLPPRYPVEANIWSLPDESFGKGWYRDPSLNPDSDELSLATKIVDEVEDIRDCDFSGISDVTFRRELIRLKETLILWDEMPCDRKIGSPRGIFLANLRDKRSFAEDLSDAIDYTVRLAGGVYASAKDLFPAEAREDVKNIDQFFSPYHLLNFKGEVKNDISLIQDKPVIREGSLALFREKAREYVKPIPKDIRLDDLDYLSQLGSQRCAFPRPRGAKRPTKTAVRFGKSYSMPSPRPFVFERVCIDKNAFESRDCVVPEEETLNSLLLLEKVIKYGYDIPSDVFHKTDFSFLEYWLSGYSRYTYIQSDQKKCGLTFPLELIECLLEVVDENSGTDFLKIFSEGYRKGIVIDPDTGIKFDFKRGVGLGMMNGAISAATAIVFELWRDRFPEDQQPSGLFYNDDQVIRFRVNTYTYSEAMSNGMAERASDWDEWMESFGLSIHRKKPFVSRSGVFLEVYGKDFPINMEKRIQKTGNLIKALNATNICHAKELFSSTCDSLDEKFDPQIAKCLSVVRSYWGTEFAKDEFTWPYELGGWMRFYKYGLNTIVESIYSLPIREWNKISVGYATIDRPTDSFSSLLKKKRENLSDISSKSNLHQWSFSSQLLMASKCETRSGKEISRAYSILKGKREAAFKDFTTSPRLFLERLCRSGKVTKDYWFPDVNSPDVWDKLGVQSPEVIHDETSVEYDHRRLWAAYGSVTGQDQKVDLYPPYHTWDEQRLLYGLVCFLHKRFKRPISVLDLVLDLYTDFSSWVVDNDRGGGNGVKYMVIDSINVCEEFENLTGIRGAKATTQLVPIHDLKIVDLRDGAFSPDYQQVGNAKYGEYKFARILMNIKDSVPDEFLTTLRGKRDEGKPEPVLNETIRNIMWQLHNVAATYDEIDMRNLAHRQEPNILADIDDYEDVFSDNDEAVLGGMFDPGGNNSPY